jgi:hypothetical protein
MNDSEWIPIKEFSTLVGYTVPWLKKLIKEGTIPGSSVIHENNDYWIFRGEIENVRKLKKKRLQEQKKIAPDGLIEYDGFLLRPEEIERLEAVRIRNGFYASRGFSGKSVEERIIEIELDEMRNRQR